MSMKTIVRVNSVVDAKEFSSFGSAALAQAFNKRRGDHPEAALIVETTAGSPVYITVGPNPPELLSGDRKVYAVFSPTDSQEPLATFFDEHRAREWAASLADTVDIRKIDSTDRVGVRANVAVVVKRFVAGGIDEALYCRLKASKEWTIPEGEMLVGESAEGCARRTMRAFGVEIGAVQIPGRVPYVNTHIVDRGHYLSLVLFTEVVTGEPTLTKQDVYDQLLWAAAADPPRPSFVTVQAIRKAAQLAAPAPEPIKKTKSRRR